MLGFKTESVEDYHKTITLNEGDALDEVVVSASRTPESVRESPVTIERIDSEILKTQLHLTFMLV